MLMGIRLAAYPTMAQKLVLSQWMGCARFVWNAKCEEDKYLTRFARCYLPVGTYAPFDQKYSQYKNKELSPWLYGCPSQILRNSTANWYGTYVNFLNGLCLKPKRKKKTDAGSIHLTRELFRFDEDAFGNQRLFIGTKTNNIGYLSFKHHKKFKQPNSIYIKRIKGRYYVSFCYEDDVDESKLNTNKEHLKYLNGATEDYLNKYTIGIDRGVCRPVQAGSQVYDFTRAQKIKKHRKEKYIKRCQKRLAKQQKGSKRREKTKRRIGKAFEKISNIRKDFCHKTSHAIVKDSKNKVIILEDLKTSSMTKKPKAVKDEQTGKWQKNNASAKAGLNKSILDKGWHQLESYLFYKSFRSGKACFKIPAYNTSQECADCGHTHPNNRKTQSDFVCERCGYTDNADANAALVIKKRAIKLILNSGTELSKRNVLLDIGRGAMSKTQKTRVICARSPDPPKKKTNTHRALGAAKALVGSSVL